VRHALAFLTGLFIVSTAQALDLQGHRGSRGHLPENTLPAFRKALDIGVTTLEMDCGITRDGVVVVHHDRRLNPDVARGPDGQWVSSPSPLIRDLTFEELQRYDVGRLRPGSEYAKRFPHQQPVDGTRVPRLSEVLKFKDVRFNIETKISPDQPQETVGAEEFARKLIAEIRKAGKERHATIQSFDWRTLKVVEREAPEIETVYLTDGKDSDPDKVRAADGKIWSPNFKDLSEEKISIANKLKLRVVPWTVNDPADIEKVLAMKVDGIISDYPDRVKKALR
jgi:glycerophosphoryl diester phosphodiesterase